jgi:plasmid stabilization system protein ParE
MTIVVSPQAGEDLQEAYEFIHKDNPIAADRVLAHIVGVIGMLASEAVTGRAVLLQDGRWVKTWPGSSLSNLLSSHWARAASDSRVSPGQTSD